MARIETYGRDSFITAFDKVIGTDADSNKASKNYEMGAIRDYVVSGLPPNGGLLKVTHVIQDTPIEDVETPEDLLNQLAIPLDVVEFEIVIVTLTFNDSNDGDRLKTRKFLLNRMLATFGDNQVDQAIANDFILIDKEHVDLISIGDEGFDLYSGFIGDKHNVRKIKSDTLEGSIDGDSVKLEIPQSIIDSSNETIVSIGDTGIDTYKGFNGTSEKHEFRRVKGGIGTTVTEDGDSIKIDTSGEVNTMSNIGGATEVFKQKTGVDFEMRTIGSDSLDVTINSDVIKVESKIDIQSIKATLTTSQILTLNTIPVEIIPAQGSGKIINIISSIAVNNFNSVAFDSSENVVLIAGGVTDEQVNFPSFISASVNKTTKGVVFASTTKQLISNTGINAQLEVANPTIGDGSIDIYVTFEVITL